MIKGAIKMNKQDLSYFEKMLNNRKAELKNRTSKEGIQSDELSNYDNHPGDQGTELSEQHKEQALNSKDEKEIESINYALSKIEQGTFGICEVSGKAIPMERLEVQPTALTLVEHADEHRESERPAEEAVLDPLNNPESTRENLKEEFLEDIENHGSSDSGYESRGRKGNE
jgi:DnaK suppressor protein